MKQLMILILGIALCMTPWTYGAAEDQQQPSPLVGLWVSDRSFADNPPAYMEFTQEGLCIRYSYFAQDEDIYVIGGPIRSFEDKGNAYVLAGVWPHEDENYAYTIDGDTMTDYVRRFARTWRRTDVTPAGYTRIICSGDYAYALTEENNAVVMRYLGDPQQPGQTISVPSQLDGYAVNAIGAHSFEGCRAEAVSLPETVRHIMPYAFTFSLVYRVELPETVTEIGHHAFYHSYLREINIPEGITEIQDSVFEECRLTSLSLPDTVLSIGDNAFGLCRNLQSLRHPDGITYIGEDVFIFFDDITDEVRIIPGLTVVVGRDSYAEQYCLKHKVPYVYAR